MSLPLQVSVSSDLLSWEKSYFEAFLKALETRCAVKRDVSIEGGPIWVIARDARRAVMNLPRGIRRPVFVSCLMAQPAPRRFGFLPGNPSPRRDLDIRWIAHTDFAFRFLKEMERVPEGKLSCIPLPGLLADESVGVSAHPLRVGILSALNADANLSFLVSVGHYVARANSDVRFAVTSSGKLSAHLSSMAQDLGLKAFESLDSQLPDLVLFAPLKTEHFAGVLWAGARGIPVLAADMPGVENLISDGHDGFILPVNDVKPVGELILRLAGDSVLRSALGDRLRQSLAKRLPLDRILNHFTACFLEPAATVVRVAA